MKYDFLRELSFAPPESLISETEEVVKQITKLLKDEIKKSKLQIQVFLGGSYAKKTLVKRDKYDLDIYLRCKKEVIDKPELVSKLVENVAKRLNFKFQTLHGSRDYYQIVFNEQITLEFIPVLSINRPEKAENVTDLSYLHVEYVKKKANKKIIKEIQITKKFLQSIGVYGAESWINGLSGYAVECLIIHYKSFLKFLQAIAEMKDKLVIDSMKYYKKSSPFIEMNESKRNTPFILVDPTFKERNVVSALSRESFLKLQSSARKFLKKPGTDYFIIPQSRVAELKKECDAKDFVEFTLVTDREGGDIAGTKLKKACLFILQELEKYYHVEKYAFDYSGGQEAKIGIYAFPDSKKMAIGPPDSMKDSVKAFRKAHKDAELLKGRWYAPFKVKNISEGIQDIVKKYNSIIKGIGITKVEF